MNNDTYPIRLKTEYDRAIADKDADHGAMSLLLGIIGAGVFVAIVGLIWAVAR